MAGRLVWALLSLGAVFLMHGVQCTTAVDAAHGGHASSSTAVVQVRAAGPVTAALDVPDLLHTAAPVVTVQAGPPAAPTGVVEHLGSLCVAVLALGLLGGLALLVVRWLRHRGRAPAVLWRGRVSGATAHASRLVRPPDLSVLCLLRI